MKPEQIISDVFEVEENNINDELAFSDIDSWDSMSHMMFITQIESAFDIMLDGEEIADMKTVEDLKSILERKRNGHH